MSATSKAKDYIFQIFSFEPMKFDEHYKHMQIERNFVLIWNTKTYVILFRVLPDIVKIEKECSSCF